MPIKSSPPKPPLPSASGCPLYPRDVRSTVLHISHQITDVNRFPWVLLHVARRRECEGRKGIGRAYPFDGAFPLVMLINHQSVLLPDARYEGPVSIGWQSPEYAFYVILGIRTIPNTVLVLYNLLRRRLPGRMPQNLQFESKTRPDISSIISRTFMIPASIKDIKPVCRE
jgi:hypothetical protein